MTNRRPTGPGLLVSVRSVAEALAALDGGADLIDVKEPSRGALGAPDDPVVEGVIAAVRGRVPVSMALGEWADSPARSVPPGTAFAKWGLSGVSECVAPRIRAFAGAAPVLVAYADHERAGSPSVERLVRAACEQRFPAFLIDTFLKDGSNLLDWVGAAALARIRIRLADHGVRLAVAGSLDATGIRALGPLAPDWFAIRAAACQGGRSGTVCSERVRQLRAVIARSRTPVGAG